MTTDDIEGIDVVELGRAYDIMKRFHRQVRM